MRAFSPADFPLPLPKTHRFPIDKYAMLRQRLQAFGWQVQSAVVASDNDLLQVHCPDYVRSVRQGTLDAKAIRALGFPWSPEMIVRSSASVGGTICAAFQALELGYGVNLAGGTHHAFRERGEGFCVFNDAVVAATKLHQANQIRTAAIVDLDVHQGNGTAKLGQELNWLTTISVHGAKNYPFRKEIGDLDIELPDATDDASYLACVQQQVLPMLADLNPDIVFLNAGADVLAGDRFGRLALTPRGVGQRDDLIYEFCQTKDSPLVWIMGGGYQPELSVLIDAHFESLKRLAARYS